MLAPWKKSYDKHRQYIKKQRHYFANKGLSSQSYSFSSSHVWMWELDHKEEWVLKNWCLRIVVMEKTLESPLDWKKIKPANLQENQSWIFIGRTDAEAENWILWPPNVNSRVIRKDPDAGQDWKQRRRRQQRMRWLDSITDSMDMNRANSRREWRTGKPSVLQSMGSQRVGHDLATEQQNQAPELRLISTSQKHQPWKGRF